MNPHASEAADITGKRILVVEDDQFIRDVYVKWFNSRGAELLTANDGALGLEVLRAQQVDLVLLDLGMPGLNGEETLKRIRADERTSSLPVLMLTNTALETDDAEYTKLFDLGATAVLQKYATSLEDLESTVAESLAKSRHVGVITN